MIHNILTVIVVLLQSYLQLVILSSTGLLGRQEAAIFHISLLIFAAASPYWYQIQLTHQWGAENTNATLHHSLNRLPTHENTRREEGRKAIKTSVSYYRRWPLLTAENNFPAPLMCQDVQPAHFTKYLPHEKKKLNLWALLGGTIQPRPDNWLWSTEGAHYWSVQFKKECSVTAFVKIRQQIDNTFIQRDRWEQVSLYKQDRHWP